VCARASRLTASGGETIVETMIDGRARERGMRSAIVTCNGTGKLEQQIAAMLVIAARR
jgi:hypothetical protein